MKTWIYSFSVYYGIGQGIVIENTKEEAIKRIKKYISETSLKGEIKEKLEDLEIELEEVPSVPYLIDLSWIG